MPLIKTIGVILIVASCGLCGFLKSLSVRSRAKKLLLFCEGLSVLYEYIEQGGCELLTALKNSFSKCDFLNFQNIKTVCCDGDLNVEDKRIINSFFVSLGHSAKKAECDRINLCGVTMKKRADEAYNDTKQKCKLYQTFGVCAGLIIGILLI